MQKTIYHTVVFGFLYLASCMFGFGQGCPTIEIVTPEGVTKPGDSFIVKAAIKGSMGKGSLKYEWTTSSGLIETGQGSDGISIRTTVEDAARNIEIKVTVLGLSSVCNNTVSEVAGIAALPIIDNVDEFGPQGADDVKARVDNIYIQLDNNPNAVAVFEMLFADNETPRQRILRITRILDAIKFRKYDLSKAIFLISNEKDFTATRVKILPLTADMSEYLVQGTLINGRDIKPKLSTLFPNK